MSIFCMIKNLINPQQAANVFNVGPDGFEAKILEEKNIVLIDVRTPEEFREGHIEGAININLHAGRFLAEVEKYKGKKIALNCRSGGRSSHALSLLKPEEFEMILHLDGGFGAWVSAGKKSVR